MRYDGVTIERVREMLDYDPATGAFTWRQRPHARSRKQVGDEAGVLKHNGNGSYRYIGLDGRQLLASQLAWLCSRGSWAKGQVGVKNSDPADLRAENLVEMNTVTGTHDHNSREGRARYQADYWAQNQEYRRRLGLRRYYGITFDDYQALFAKQNGVCAICAQPETAVAKQGGKVRWLSVDHDHGNGQVRGLLCNACNHALGEMKDDPERLRTAADYIERHRALHTDTAPDNVVPLVKKETA